VEVPPDAYAQAMLGIYEMGRVELLRDLFICAYGHSTEEHVVISQNSAEPDPLCLTHLCLTKETVRAVVLQPQADAQTVVEAALPAEEFEAEHQALRVFTLDELRFLNEGMLWRAMACPTSSMHGSRRKAYNY